MIARRIAVAALVVAAVACGTDQDPGLVDTVPGSATTSNTLGTCPPGGPDTTTPAAGCLGPDGEVLRP